MIVIIIGTVLSATPTPLVEVQDTVVLVAQDFANNVITLKNEMVGYFPTTFASLLESCQPDYLIRTENLGYDATNYSSKPLNWDCPIRGSPV